MTERDIEAHITQLGKRRRKAIATLDERTEELRVAITEAVTSGHVSENRAAELAGVTRMTVRAWLGK